jgi:enoyl-CoA hydratase/carnithine racemase
VGDEVLVDVNAGLAVLTLNRPEHLNAYTAEMGTLLSQAYRSCDEDDDVRAISFELRKPVIAAINGHAIGVGLTIALQTDIRIVADDASAAEAVGFGVANKARPAAQVLDHAVAMARDIATNVAPMSAALCKRLLWDTDDAREGVAAFLDRRAPRFSARLSADWTPLPEPAPEP